MKRNWLVICFLCFDGLQTLLAGPNVFCWGRNDYGQTNVPSDLTNAVAIAAGVYHCVALKSDGNLVAWGGSQYGQSTIPPGLTNISAFTAGSFHNLAVKSDGSVVAWGFNTYHQTSVPLGLSNVIQVAAGYSHSVALKADGTVVAWGNGSQTNVPVGLSNVVAVGASFYHSMALKADGSVIAWGGNVMGVTDVPTDLTNAVKIIGNMTQSVSHSLALRADGTVVSWGYAKTNPPPDLTNVVSIAAGGIQYASSQYARDLALLADGRVVGWGAITNIPSNLTNVLAISCGEAHEMALLNNGEVKTRPSLVQPSFNTNCFKAFLPTISGQVYRLEYINLLGGTNWTALPLVAGNGCLTNTPLFDFTADSTQRFYRTAQW